MNVEPKKKKEKENDRDDGQLYDWYMGPHDTCRHATNAKRRNGEVDCRRDTNPYFMAFLMHRIDN